MRTPPVAIAGELPTDTSVTSSIQTEGWFFNRIRFGGANVRGWILLKEPLMTGGSLPAVGRCKSFNMARLGRTNHRIHSFDESHQKPRAFTAEDVNFL